MDVKQDSVLIAIRYVLLDFRQNGHEKWYVYLLHFVVNCIASNTEQTIVYSEFLFIV